MKKFLLLFLFSIFINSYSQEYIFGKVISEQNIQVTSVLVLNVRTDEKTFTDQDGNFMIEAKNNDVLRFVKQKLDRVSYQIKPEDFKKSLVINMVKSAIEIQEVEIKNKLTGFLKEDISRIESKQKTKLNKEITKFIAQKSDITVIKPKAGEFVQPKGEGFSIGGVSPKWDNVDLTENILHIFGEDYFEELGLKKDEITPFISYVISSLDVKEAKKKGYFKSNELAKFQTIAEEKIKTFKKLK